MFVKGVPGKKMQNQSHQEGKPAERRHLANTLRNNNVNITSQNRFDVIMTLLLRSVFAGNQGWKGVKNDVNVLCPSP